MRHRIVGLWGCVVLGCALFVSPALFRAASDVDSLYTIGARYSVIIAQPVKIVTTLRSDGNLIVTWYKLKVTELITKQPSVPQEPPLGQRLSQPDRNVIEISQVPEGVHRLAGVIWYVANPALFVCGE